MTKKAIQDCWAKQDHAKAQKATPGYAMGKNHKAWSCKAQHGLVWPFFGHIWPFLMAVL